MREYKDHIKTSITLKDNILKLMLTTANHIYVEAEDGWFYRGRRHRFTAHVTFNGREWELQPSLRHNSTYCPDLSPAGEKTVVAAMLLALNTVVGGAEWFAQLRAQAEANNANNEIFRAEEKIKELEQKLDALKAHRQTLLVTEAAAEAGIFPAAYVEE